MNFKDISGLVTLLKAFMHLHSRKAFRELEVKSLSKKFQTVIDGLDIAGEPLNTAAGATKSKL